MNRYFFTFFSVFLCSCFHVNAQQPQPLIDMVSVDTSLQKITISWHFTDGIDSATLFTIYKCTENCNSQNYFNDVDRVIQSEFMWQDTAADLSIPNYYCIGWVNSGKSPPHCNMALEATPSEDGCNNAVLLTWNPYINMPDSLDHYKIFYRKQESDTAFLLLDSVTGTQITGFYFNPANKLRYTARSLANTTTYDFLIQAVNKTNTDTLRPFSNIATYTTKYEVDTLVPVSIDRVTVEDDSYLKIDVSTDPYTAPFQYLFLLRDKPRNVPLTPDLLSFSVIDTIDSSGYTTLNQYSFEDKEADPFSGLYYYWVVAEHKCKASDTSNILTNIYLTGGRVEKYKDTMSFVQRGFNLFTPQEPYKLFRVVSKDSYPITSELTIKNCISDLTTKSCNYSVDVLPFMDEGNNPKYRIESGNGSYSNTFTIWHEPVITFPNAFYPESTYIENKTFYPIIKFPSEKSYLFIIYNRWGEEVFRATQPPPIYNDYENPTGRWDGTFKGKDCPVGIYAFKLSFYIEGIGNYTESGTFMLIR